jgi:SNF2 family DNA or RNA helicase
MICLHVSLLDGVPYLWAELAGGETPKKGTDPSGEPPWYPYDPGGAFLQKTVKRLLPGFKVSKRKTLPVTLWLPSRGSRPVRSCLRYDDTADRRFTLRLKPWRTRARSVDMEELVRFCSIADVQDGLGEKLVLGPSFSWIGALWTCALDIVAGENFLPGVVEGENGREARWIPMPETEQEAEIQKLGDSMPGICRCLTLTGEEPPLYSPLETAKSLVARMTDHLVRESAGYAKDQRPEEAKKGFPSIHDAWIHALTSLNPVIQGPDTAVAEFKNQVDQWQRKLVLVRRSPFRFCLRLHEPDKEDPEEKEPLWKVEYLVKAKADPTLQVPLSQLWGPESPGSRELQKYGPDVREYLYTVLGQAARICPAVSESLESKNPGGFHADNEGILEFLNESAEKLAQAGFSLMLPSWWLNKAPGQKPRVKVKVKATQGESTGGFSLDSLFQFDYRFCYEGRELSLAELEELARLKSPLVRLRGQWTYISEEGIKAAIDFLRGQKEGTLSGREILRMSLGEEGEAAGFPIEGIETEGWLKKVLDKLKEGGKFELRNPPEGLSGELRPYQRRGYSWLHFLQETGLGACLADDMGLGKTIQTLSFIQNKREEGETRPFLLICPTSVVNNWKMEAEKFTPRLDVLIHHGSDRRKKERFQKEAARYAMVLSSYGLIARDIDFLREVPWAGIVLDEAQNIRNHETKRARACRAVPASCRIALTGTPVENHVGDLWSIMDFLNPGLLGNYSYFKTNFHRPIQVWKNEEAASRLRKITAPFILRRLKTDRSVITDLPEKIETREYCNLTREQVSLYKAVLDEVEDKIESSEGMERKGLILSTLTRLKQICNHPSQYAKDDNPSPTRSGKQDRLFQMLHEIREGGERSLVFTQYAEMGRIPQQSLVEEFMEDVFFICGATPRKRRDEMVRIFQEDQDAPHIFVLSLKAGGTGLNLSRANHVFHYDRWWNPAVENQATDRAFRIGQKKNVLVHKFVVVGTLEERIDRMIESKSEIAEQVLGKGEAGLTELSNEEIKNLIKLGKEAAGD